MTDTLDKLLELGSAPDWISPLWAIIQDFINGPHHDFYTDQYAGWSVKEIKKLLKRNGVYVWGFMFLDDMIVFSVRRSQAKWTQYLLKRAGIPILGMS